MIKLLCFVLVLWAAILLCHSAKTKKPCQESCAGKTDGNYTASCSFDCHQYVYCFFGFSFKKTCPSGKYFDIDTRKCVVGCPTGPRAVTNCTAMSDGLYQHCCFCDTYVTCANYGLFFHSLCPPGGLAWDDAAHKCLWSSTTCTKHERYSGEAWLPIKGENETIFIQA